MPARLARGMRVGNRYLLERELGSGSDGTTWEALDERLDRPVALRIFGGGLDRKTIVKRAGIAASLTHPRVVRVFDTGEDAGRFFTVSELVPDSLQTIRLPMPAGDAIEAATDIAEALHYAHERGVVHGNLHEANVLLSEGGAKVGDFALNHSSEHADRDDDLRSFGALLRRITKMPDPNAPPGLSRVVEGLASGAYTSAAEVLGELRELHPKPSVARAGRPRRGWLYAVIAVLLGLIAFGAMQLGERSPKQRLVPGGRIEGTPLSVVGSDDFDPEGDNSEGAGSVRNASDGDPATFWATERYSGADDFSALRQPKSGVGLIFDLGKSVEVGKAQVLFTTPGCSFEWRYSENKTAPVGEWATAAELKESPNAAPLVFDASNARYWLLWITKLTTGTPGAGDKFACGVREADLFSP